MRNLSSQCSSLSCDSSTAPTAPPASVTETTVTPNSVTVQWEEVPCLDRNGEITDYQVVTRNSQGMTVGTADVDVAARQATICGLTPSTQYTVSVAAVNGAGTGPVRGISIETTGEVIVFANEKCFVYLHCHSLQPCWELFHHLHPVYC